ncbi:hypothetical protein E24_00192 [Faustovirus]|nr:hypothetical protein E24_00192 [Faustovirus]AMN84104.1 hypothetical protein D5a_00191 [Faustovirus]AMN85092.1 hypothetical protein E23_00191 [Faustovirus]
MIIHYAKRSSHKPNLNNYFLILYRKQHKMEACPVEIFYLIAKPCDLLLTIVAFGLANHHLYENFMGLVVRFKTISEAHKKPNLRAIKPSDPALASLIVDNLMFDFATGDVSLNYMNVFRGYYGKCVIFDHSKKTVAEFVERVLLFEHIPEFNKNITEYPGKAKWLRVDYNHQSNIVLDRLFKFIKVKLSWEWILRLLFIATYTGHDFKISEKLWVVNFDPAVSWYKYTSGYFHNIIDEIKQLIGRGIGISYNELLNTWMQSINTSYHKTVQQYLYE